MVKVMIVKEMFHNFYGIVMMTRQTFIGNCLYRSNWTLALRMRSPIGLPILIGISMCRLICPRTMTRLLQGQDGVGLKEQFITTEMVENNVKYVNFVEQFISYL